MKYSTSTNCTKCNSTETKSFEMVYNTGTSSGTIAVGTYNPDDGFGISSGNISSQTLLAQKVKPPVKPEWTMAQIAAVVLIGFIAFIITASTAGAFISLILGFGLSILLAVLFTRQNAKLKPAYQRDYDKWLRSWICLKCGTNWQFRQR